MGAERRHLVRIIGVKLTVLCKMSNPQRRLEVIPSMDSAWSTDQFYVISKNDCKPIFLHTLKIVQSSK